MYSETTKKRLVITVDDGERAELSALDDIQSDVAMWDFLEPLVCNSDLDWISPAETGDLTDAPMLGRRNESGEVMERWAFMDYQVRSPLEDFLSSGRAVFVA